MGRRIQLEAIYREGVLQPLEPLALPEDQQVTISVYIPEGPGPEETLRAWQQVYTGLSEDDVAEVKSIALSAPPASFTAAMRGLHKEVWEGVDIDKWLEEERSAWE